MTTVAARRLLRRSTPRHRARHRSLIPAVLLVLGLLAAVTALYGLLPSDQDREAGRDSPSATRTTTGAPSAPVVDARLEAARVRPLEAVEISGHLADGPPGAHVTVQQRKEGRWMPFPLRPAVDGSGGFVTYVELAQPGVHELRVVEPHTGASSPILRIRVR